ncbi:MAG: two-component regulator propeller domain-containing protein [Bryobacteraceae bacterium]
MRRAIWPVFCAAAVFLAAPAMALSPDAPLEGYARRVWHAEDGLPEETVQAFAQTPDHFLWIGTTGGLVRFDGAQFVVFNRENTRAFRENSTFCLAVARDGSLWIGTEGGGLLRYKNGVFRSWSAADGLTNGYVRAVYEDNAHDIWAGTDDGLFRLHNDTVARIDGRAGIPFSSVHAIHQDRAGRLWVGGYHFFALNGGQVTEFSLPGGLADNVKSILGTRDGTIWVGTVGGLQRRPPGGVFTRVAAIRSTVRSLREDPDGTLWIGAIGEGLIRYRDGAFTRFTAPAVLPSNTVLSSFKDTEHNLWVGTQAGLLRLSRTAVSTFPLPDAADADFGAIYEDRDGALWMTGTHLYRFTGQRAVLHRFPPPLSDARVRNVFRDSSGALWIGTEGRGVFRWAGGRPVQIPNTQGYIRAFAEDRDHSIWIGTDGDYCRWRPQGMAYYEEHESVRALLVDRDGDLWVGKDRGLSRLRAGQFLHDAVTDRLRNEKVWAIHQDAEGALWFGTRGGGLFRWKAGKLAVFTTAQGLASNSVYQILEDPRGNLWMSGPNGISSVSRRDLDLVAQDPAYRPAVKLYGTSDGLETTQMYGGVQPAGCITAHGEIWFPSTRGPVRIGADPGGPASPPAAFLYRVVADGRDVSTSGDVKLAPGGGKLEIRYGAIRLRSQERVRFKYRLEEFDSDWTETRGTRVAAYTNIPPGRYRFRVLAFDMNNPQDTSEASVEFDWRPHFYRAGWFFLLCLASLLTAAWGVHRLRMRQAHEKFAAVLEERGRLAREMHDTLIQGCTGASVLLEASLSLRNSTPEMKHELLEHARDLVRTTLDESRRAVWNLRQKAAAPGGIALRLSEIARQIGEQAGVPIGCESTGMPVTLDQETEHHLLLAVREALSNAVRHGHPKAIRIQLASERKKLRTVIADDGCGFTPPTADRLPDGHYGLVGMRERIEYLDGTFSIESSPGHGTRVEITVPVGKGQPRTRMHEKVREHA